ncbi:MAG: hypothetical protein KGR98_06600 [Verrucomicrobia bacterium]|nr:hypothetical protein [Verrucomicrobiota bacterium]MDE3099137.1 hypothetical protein [Verrucomicrobiota bacterium]
MKKKTIFLGAAAAGCAVGMALPSTASAEISDADFSSLTNAIQQLQQQETQDQQTIQELQRQLGQTRHIAASAAQKAQEAQTAASSAASGRSATHNFMLVGDAEVQFGKYAGQHSGFALADFAPIFLYRANDNILFEAGFDTSLNSNDSTTFSMSFGQLDYVLNDYMTFVAGDMLVPLGTYNMRSAGWLTKLINAPLIDDQILPGAEIGAQLRGSLPINDNGAMVTYSVFGVNGPGSNKTDPVDNVGDLDTGANVGQANQHTDPSGGGRIGWFYPWELHHDIELGLSGQSGQWGIIGNHLWSAAVLDAAAHFGPNIEVKGEYANTWFGSDDAGMVHQHGWWVEAAYKLAGLNLELPVVNDVELVSRYDRLNDGQGTKTDRYTAGFVYYFTDTLLFEGDYEYCSSHGPAALAPNDFLLQIQYGF